MNKQSLGNYIEEYNKKVKNNADIPVYSVTNKQGFCKEYFSKDVSSKDISKYKIVPRGYFAYNPSRINVGSIDWQNCEDEVAVSPLYVVFKCSPNIDKDYLKYFLKSDYGKYLIKSKSVGSVRNNLKFSTLSDFVINIGTIEEQQEIVKKIKNIEHAILNEQRLLQLYDELIKARFVEMFKNKGYERVLLSKLVDCKVSSAKKDFIPEDVIKYIDITSIDNSNNKMTGYTEYVLKEAPSRAQQHILKNDIVVSTVRPNLKNVALNQYDYKNLVASSGFCVLRVKNNICPEYIKAIVCSDDFTNKMTELTTGANYPAIHNSDVMNYIVDNPPIELQNEFAEFVKQVDKSRATIQKNIDLYQELFDKLMNDYFDEGE